MLIFVNLLLKNTLEKKSLISRELLGVILESLFIPSQCGRHPYGNGRELYYASLFLLRFVNEKVREFLFRIASIFCRIKPLFQGDKVLALLLGRTSIRFPKRPARFFGHARNEAVFVVKRCANGIHRSLGIPRILENFACLGVEARSQKARYDEACRTGHLPCFRKRVRLPSDKLFHESRHFRRVLENITVTHLNKQSHATRQIRIMSMMKVIDFTAFDKTAF